MNKSFLLLLTLFLLQIHCISESSETANNSIQKKVLAEKDISNKNFLYNVEFLEIDTFGATEKILFQYIGQFVVDRTERVIIADKNDLKVFDSNNNYIKTLGRKGRGPGEFDNFGALELENSLNKLFVYDEMLSRISVFNLNSLAFEHAISINPKTWKHIPELSKSQFKNFKPLNDSLLIVGLINSSDRENKVLNYLLMNDTGKIVSNSLFSYKDYDLYNGQGVPKPIAPNSPVVFPSARSSIIETEIETGEYIYSSWTDYFKIFKHDKNGNTINILEYEFENAQTDEDEIRSVYKYNKVLYAKSNKQAVNKTWPAINNFFLDDEDRIWVSTIIDDEQNYQWYVLKNTGELITKFKWKGERLKRHYKEREIKLVRNGYLYTLEESPDTREKKVVKYKIVLKKRE